MNRTNDIMTGLRPEIRAMAEVEREIQKAMAVRDTQRAEDLRRELDVLWSSYRGGVKTRQKLARKGEEI